MATKSIYLFALLCFYVTLAQPAWTQSTPACGTDVLQTKLQEIPAYRTQAARTREDYQEFLAQPRPESATYIIPTVVHIVQHVPDTTISDARILEQIAIMNEDFRLLNADTTIIPPIFKPVAADTDIEFRLASIDPHGCPTDGINRVTSPFALLDWDYGANLKGATQWDPYKYMNIWVVEAINRGTLAGYTINPDYLAVDPTIDGIVVGAIYFGRGYTSPISPNQSGKTLTHEVGHYLGLQHTFWGACGGTTPADCMSAGDLVCDTPPVAAPSAGCINPTNTCTETPIDLPDQVYNHMDYTADDCRVMFTQGQADRMHFYLNGIRASLISPANLAATGCDGTVSPGCAPRAQFSSSARHICVGDSIRFTDISPGDATSWSWTFTGGMPGNSAAQNPAVSYPTPGIYPVTLEVTNGFGTSTMTDTTYVQVSVASSPPLVESFEASGGLPVDWYRFDEDGLGTWQVSTSAASEGGQSMYHANYGGYFNRSIDDLVSRPIDLSGAAAGFLTYDLAYRRYNGFQQDTLYVQMSTDCGRTWQTEWVGAGNALATVPGNQLGWAFVPTATQWRRDSIDLAPYVGGSDLRIRFRVKGGAGQDIYLDRVNIAGIVSAGSRTDFASQMSVVSPMGEAVELSCHVARPMDLELTLVDVRGKAVLQESVRLGSGGHQRIRLWAGRVEGLAQGIYFLRVQAEEGIWTRKVVK